MTTAGVDLPFGSTVLDAGLTILTADEIELVARLAEHAGRVLWND